MATSLPEGGNDTEGTDFLATQRVFGAGRPGVGLDVLATKIAVDFQGLTSEGGDSCIKRNLDALREAAELDAICIVLFNNERTVIERVASSTAMFTPFDPQVMKGDSLERIPWLAGGLGHLRIAEIRDTHHAAARAGRGRRTLRRAQHALAARLRALASRSRARLHGFLLDAASRELGCQPAPAAEAHRHQLCDRARAAARRAAPEPPRRAERACRSTRRTTGSGTSTSTTTRCISRRAGGTCSASTTRPGDLAGLAQARPSRRHGPRADHDPRAHRRQDADVRKRAPHAALQRRVALGSEPRQGARRLERPAQAAGRRRVRHHRAQALRGRALPREGKRADHAAVDRRRRDHHGRAPQRRVPEPGGRGADRAGF